MGKRELIIPYKPRPEQLQIHSAQSGSRFVVVVAHRRMGKTVSAINELIKAAIENPKKNPRYAYIAPTYTQAKRIAWDYLLEYTRVLEAEHNVSELRVDFWGRRIQLAGSDNPDSLRGQYFDGVVLDEIGDQDPRIWTEIVRPSLADRQGWCIFLGTPKGANHFKTLRDRAESEEGWKLLEFRASETNILPASELEATKREIGDEKYNQEFECSFHAAVEGSYYGSLINDIEAKGHITEVVRDDLCQTYVAWDLGMGDSTSIWVAQIAGQEIRLVDFVESHGVGLDWYVKWLRERDWHKAEQLLPHDVQVRELGTGKSRLEVLREAGLNVRVLPRLGVDDGIQAVRRILPRCWFDSTYTKEGLERLRDYRREYDDRRQVFYDKPLHNYASHAADSFRYLATGLGEGSTSEWSKPFKIDTRWIV